MGIIDYSREPHSDIAFFDMKSFYASVECVERGLDPLTTSLCVVSRSDNSKGLILASSPTFKRIYGKKNVGRSYDLPFNIHTRRFNYQAAKRQKLPTSPEYVRYIELWARKTLIVPPRMGHYIDVNMQIQKILQDYAAPEDILPYSIDEGFIDLTKSLNYFSSDKLMTRRDKLDLVSARIQYDIWRQTGVYSTIGMSNANPLLAKLALDNEAKYTKGMRANWSYEDVESKVWKIKELTDFWGIGSRMAKRLNRMKIYSIYDLAMSNPDDLKREFGVIGVQNWFHAHGVDESNVHEKYKPKSKGLGNSQVLPHNYIDQRAIELVLKEMGEQVAIRLRRARKNTMTVAIHVGYSSELDKKSINAQRSIDPTQNTKELQKVIVELFRQHYTGGSVRTIGIRYENLVDESIVYYTLFTDIDKLEKENRLDQTIDQIRQKYGFLSLQKATALTKHSRSIARSKLIGGHSAGGLDGLE
ncbi:Y-family DNA polymerase [Aerococcaceae bacterium DSM 111022]|nr:Y-family DNA polymerase [Aerococcaceae bacterium DSM 111022]